MDYEDQDDVNQDDINKQINLATDIRAAIRNFQTQPNEETFDRVNKLVLTLLSQR